MRRRDFALSLFAASRPDRFAPAAMLFKKAVDSGQVRAAALYAGDRSGTLQQGFGAAASADAVFLIASITKPMTAAAVMTLVDRRELTLDDPVRKFIPEFSEGGRRLITIRHLLTHTSGLPDMLPENVELRKRHAPLSEFVARTVRTPLLFKPGARVQYQSMGILLAAEAAARITRQPFPQYLTQAVFRPLGMTRTALGLGSFKIPETMQCQVQQAPGLYGGGSKETASWDWNSPYWRNLAAPWGGAHSTAPDIARFLAYFLNPTGSVLKPETAAAMVVNQAGSLNQPWGIGFMVKPGSFGRACSPRTFGHSGSTGTIAWADPANQRICVALTTLPADVSQKTLLDPACDRVSEA
jgi:beta-lactamase class C